MVIQTHVIPWKKINSEIFHSSSKATRVAFLKADEEGNKIDVYSEASERLTYKMYQQK